MARGAFVPVFTQYRRPGAPSIKAARRMDTIADRLAALEAQLQRHQGAKAFAATPCEFDPWGRLYAETGRSPLTRAEMVNTLRRIGATPDADPPAPLTDAEVASVLAASDF